MKANIVICNYNYEKYVVDAINSALNQSYKNLQITVVDDCSTDNSVKVINDAFFKGFSHSKEEKQGAVVKKVIHNNIEIIFIQLLQNHGPSFARNVAIDYTINSTDVFFILDSDDIYYENKVLRCIQEISVSPDLIGVVYTDYDIYNIDTKITARTFKEVYTKGRLYQECIVHSGAAITKKALLDTLEQTGFYDGRIKGPEDYDLWLRISEKFIIVHIPESHSLVRVTGKSISSPKNPEFNQNYTNGFNIIRHKVAERASSSRN